MNNREQDEKQEHSTSAAADVMPTHTHGPWTPCTTSRGSVGGSCAAHTSADPPTEEGVYEVWHVDNPNLAKERKVYEEDGELVVDVPKDSLVWSVARCNPTVEEYNTEWHRWRGPLERAKA